MLDKLASAGVSEAVVNVHYLPDQISQAYCDRDRPRIIISDDDEVLGTGGAVVKALPLLGEEPFFHVNADTMWIDGVRPNLARLAETFDPERMDILLLMAIEQHRLCRSRRLRDAAEWRVAQAPEPMRMRPSMPVPRSCRPHCLPTRRRESFR